MTTLATATTKVEVSDKLVYPDEQKKNMRRMSISFMSDEVARMTMMAAAAASTDAKNTTGTTSKDDKKKGGKKSKNQKKKPASSAPSTLPQSSEATTNEQLVRRTLVHRAIKKLRQTERLALRSAVSVALAGAATLHGHRVGVAEKSVADDEALYEDADAEEKRRKTGEGGNSKLLMGTITAAKKLRRVPAKPTWFSQYQSDFQYEHRIQKDGFDFIFEYKAHFGNTVKAFFPTALIDGPTGVRREVGLHLSFISLDRTGFNYWETSSSENAKHQSYTWAPPETKRRVVFNRRQAEFIQAICFLPNKGMYIGAGLDMMVHLYDKNLNYLTALPTGERVIRHIVYNPKLDEIIIAGSDGCKAWKLNREYAEGRSLYDLRVVRSYSAQIVGSESHWVSHIEFDNVTQRVILIEEDRVACINCINGELMSLLKNIHEAPVTGAVWYNRSQYFITCCSGGKVKVWAMHHDSDMRFGKHDYALLHVFTGHTKSVTAVQLHPMSGLAASVSLDGTIRVLNLEALEEIYVLQINDPLIAMNIVKISDVWYCLGATVDGHIRVWSINDCLGFFGVCRAVCQEAYQSNEIIDGTNQLNVVIVAGEDVRIFTHTGRLISNLVPGQLDGSIECCSYSITHGLLFILQKGFKKGKTVAKLSIFDSRKAPCELLCHIPDPGSQTENDFSTSFIIANFRPLDIEDYKLHRKTGRRISIEGGSVEGGGNSSPARDERDTQYSSPTASPTHTNADGSPTHSGKKSHLHGSKAIPGFRGTDDHPISDQCLVVGTMVGSLVFLQPGPNPKVVATFKDAHDSNISFIHYLPARRTLFTFGLNLECKTVMNAWNIPSLNLNLCLPLRGPPTAIAFSKTMPYCAMGYADGTMQLVDLSGINPGEVDNHQTLEQHTAEITSISFCDELQVYCSASKDSTLKVWDLGNRLINRVVLNKSPDICFFNGGSGDIIIAQGTYMLKVALGTWIPVGGVEAAKKIVKPIDNNTSPTLKFVKEKNGRGSIVFIDPNGSEVGNFIGVDGGLHRKIASGRTRDSTGGGERVANETLQATLDSMKEIMSGLDGREALQVNLQPRGARRTRKTTTVPFRPDSLDSPGGGEPEAVSQPPESRVPSKPTTPMDTRSRDGGVRNLRNVRGIDESVSKYIFESISNMATDPKNIDSRAPPLKNVTKGLTNSLKMGLTVPPIVVVTEGASEGDEDQEDDARLLDC